MQASVGRHLVEAVDQLLVLVGREWVEQRVTEVRAFEVANERTGGRQTGMRSFHPLAVSAHHYLAARDLESAKRSMGDRLARLAMLADAVALLRNVPGVADRVARLTASDALFYSTEFELLSAALYKSMGHQARFVNEGRTPTFDLLIDNAVEAECKQVAPTTQDDRAADDIWSILDRRLRALFDRHEGVFFLHVKVPGRPERAHVVEVIDKVSAHVAAGVGDASYSSGPIHYQFARTVVDFADRGIRIDLPRWFPSWAQRFKPELGMVFDGGRPVEGRACFLAFDSRPQRRTPHSSLVTSCGMRCGSCLVVDLL